MIKVCKDNIDLLKKFLKKEVYTIATDVPIMKPDGNITGWHDVEIKVRQGKNEFTITDGTYLKKEYNSRTEKYEMAVFIPSKYKIADYINKGYRTYLLGDIEYKAGVIEYLEDRNMDFIIDEPLNILCIRN